MRIGELCKQASVSKELVRHYEELGLIQSYPVQAGTRHYREFKNETVRRLQLIGKGKSIGLSLNEIRPLLNAYLDGSMSSEQALSILTEQYLFLETRAAEIKQMQQLIKDKIVYVQNKQSSGESLQCQQEKQSTDPA